MENGWIKVYRDLEKKGYYRDSEIVHLWLHILLKASHKETEFLWNQKIVKLQPGQFITGRKAIAKATGVNRSKVERVLALFVNEGQIEQQTTNKFRLITVKNWDKYQKSEQQVSNKRATSEQQVSTFKNVKNVKNEKKEHRAFDEFWESYPRKTSKKAALTSWKKLDPSPELLSKILSSLETQKNTRQWKKDNGEFIPHASTWLNQERWNDTHEEPVKKPRTLTEEEKKKLNELGYGK